MNASQSPIAPRPYLTARRHTAWALGVLTVAASAGLARGAEPAAPDQKALLDRIDTLEAEVKSLRAAQAKQAAYDDRDIDRTVNALLLDASRHSLLFPP